jgi:hypothetical protein
MIMGKKGVEDSGIPGKPQPVVQSRFSGREEGLTGNFLDTTNLVRSIQRAEGNPDCFRKAEGYCNRLDCTWRRYCLREEVTHPEERM